MLAVRAVILAVGLIAVVGAQEFPTAPQPTAFDCTLGCGKLPNRWVACWTWVRLGSGAQGPRCRTYCQYRGMPQYDPGPGWRLCHSVAPAGIACNATWYLIDGRLVCDAGQADGLVP